MENKKVAMQVKVYGVVQGVGFRPYIYRVAALFGLKGWVLNHAEGVVIHWEGKKEQIDAALVHLPKHLPSLAVVDQLRVETGIVQNYSGFFIQDSHYSAEHKTLISPDIGICSDCQREMFDPSDRRYRYPLINCTNCGPRFTIIRGLPYDRHRTTMQEFSLCVTCSVEYHNPENRRFHAQPTACPVCGPKVFVEDGRGNIIGSTADLSLSGLLSEGAILGVKSLGGFHLICDAENRSAVRRLRMKKRREEKPFALMAANLDIVRQWCTLSVREEEALVSPARPIVILDQREEARKTLSADINPGLTRLGVMLPYTPLHMLLFSERIKGIVATSANHSNDPLVITVEEARRKLAGAADYFITHNREIEHPCDDSVGQVMGNSYHLIRRARGYVPLPIAVTSSFQKPLLACGGDSKSTFALARNGQVFVSQHLGDLDNYQAYERYQQTLEKMMELLRIKPQVVIHDLHPGYISTSYAKELGTRFSVPVVSVQHHEAHMASCMAEHGIADDVVGVICDGTGFGRDNSLWGFEFFVGKPGQIKRVGHMKKVALPGGEVTIRYPGRMACSFLQEAYGSNAKEPIGRWMSFIEEKEREILTQQINKRINTWETSSCGRLFDGAAALLDLCREQCYEGQAPMALEHAAAKAGRQEGMYDLPLLLQEKQEVLFYLDPSPLWQAMVRDLEKGIHPFVMAAKFHQGVAHSIVEGAAYIAGVTGLKKVVLSGGVFQNKRLVEEIIPALEKRDLQVYTQQKFPANDGGLSLGQAIIGNEVVTRVFGSTL